MTTPETPRQPLLGPSVWDASTLAADNSWQQTLSADECATIKRLAAGETLAGDNPLWQRLAKIQEQIENHRGIVRLSGFPLDELAEAKLETIFQQLLQAIGTPLPQSAAGETVFRVEDARLSADNPAARGPNTAKALSFHSDRCDVIAFLCVRPASSGGDNLVVSTPALHNRILAEAPELLEVLYQPFPWKRHNFDAANPRPWVEMPVFSQHQGEFASNLMQVLILRAHQDPELPNLSAQQLAALELVQDLAADPAMHCRFRQQPGDLVFLNNFVTLHSRTAFVDDSPAGRLLLRAWLSMPNSRPLAPCWAPNYGNTAPGAHRGGIRVG